MLVELSPARQRRVAQPFCDARTGIDLSTHLWLHLKTYNIFDPPPPHARKVSSLPCETRSPRLNRYGDLDRVDIDIHGARPLLLLQPDRPAHGHVFDERRDALATALLDRGPVRNLKPNNPTTTRNLAPA